jgi:2,3-bisphosphoglycerate-independent phosphoglycerate mutase
MPDINIIGDRARPVVLCVLDGWGSSLQRNDNAVTLAHTPNWDRFMATLPSARLDAAGRHVGLPDGQMGNSEVGHMNLGAGRIVMQDLPRINMAISNGLLSKNPVLLDLMAKLRKSGGTCHLMGLLSPGGVHSHQDHFTVLAGAINEAGIPIAMHAFLDGRDTPPKSARGFMEKFLVDTAAMADFTIATVGGRYYSMDRDQRWERLEKAYSAMVNGIGETAPDPITAIEQSYAAGTGDEFVLPTVIEGYGGMTDGDALLMANFRADRARQILSLLTDPDFEAFQRSRLVRFAALSGLTEYSAELNKNFASLFPSLELKNILGEVVANAGMSQLRIAETEKYAHVTFFLNGGLETVFPGEERTLVPSPQVATYDLTPEMSAPQITDKLIAAIGKNRFDLVVVNYANGDMVGHTGILSAAIKAAKCVDICLGRLERAVSEAGGMLLITADHGNCEQMYGPGTSQPHTAHSLNRVPVVLSGGGKWHLRDGRLADVAPTLLRLLGLPRPKEMTGRSLILEDGADRAAVR